MKTWIVTWKYEALSLFRNYYLLSGLVLVLLAGVFGAQYGRHVIVQQEAVIDTVSRAAEQRTKSLLERVVKQDSIEAARAQVHGAVPLRPDVVSRSGYYLAFGGAAETVIWHPAPFASLSVGQKDQYPFYHELSPASDIHDERPAIIRNPQTMQVGNFDLSFVLVYLFPLLIIAMGYNVLSEERENGTLTLMRVQGDHRRVLLGKLAFRTTVVLALGLLLNLLAFWIAGIHIDIQATAVCSWLVATSLYILFWFSLVFLVVSMDWSGAVSALVLGGCWVLFLLLVPAYIQGRVENPQVQEQARQLFNQRGDFPRASDLSDKVLVDSFLHLRHLQPLPASLSDTAVILADPLVKSLMTRELQVRFTHSLGHRVVAARDSEYRAALLWNWVNPAYVAQHAFNQIARTELNHYHDYLKSVEELQTARRYYVYQFLDGKRYDTPDFEAQPRFEFLQEPVTVARTLGWMLPMIVVTMLLVIMAALRRSRAG